jgi:hypothetical protein
MRSFALAVLTVLTASSCAASSPSFPAFPSSSGDAFAILDLASMTKCAANDQVCEKGATELYRSAALKGQSAALAMLRLRTLERQPSRASEFNIGSSVCNRSKADAGDIVRQIEAIELAGDDGRSNKWQVSEISGSDGSVGARFSRGPIGATLVFSGNQLRLVRVFTNILEIGSGEGRFEAVQRANASIARAVCPRWNGVGEAISGYIVGVAQSWPPQAVHVDGPSVWLAATGVTPDIFWFDLYVDPLHNPFTSAGSKEQFKDATGLGLVSRSP